MAVAVVVFRFRILKLSTIFSCLICLNIRWHKVITDYASGDQCTCRAFIIRELVLQQTGKNLCKTKTLKTAWLKCFTQCLTRKWVFPAEVLREVLWRHRLFVFLPSSSSTSSKNSKQTLTVAVVDIILFQNLAPKEKTAVVSLMMVHPRIRACIVGLCCKHISIFKFKTL